MEAFTINNQTGRIDPASQIDMENIVEYCRGLVTRVKTNKVSYLRLAHKTAHDYFRQVEQLRKFHNDMCMTCLTRILSCLNPQEKAIGVDDALNYGVADMDEGSEEIEDSVDNSAAESSEDEADRGEYVESEDGYEIAESENSGEDQSSLENSSEASDSQSFSEDYESWRSNGAIWPTTLLPWVAIKTPFSLYAGKYALAHLADSVITTDMELAILKLIKATISQRRCSTFSGEFKDHPYRMNMLHMAAFIGIPSVIEDVLEIPTIHINDKDILGRTALMWALATGKEIAAQKLLEKGAQIQVYDQQQRSTLLYASAIRNRPLLENLFQTASEKDIDSHFLCSCAKTGNIYLMEEAFSRANINVDDKDESGRAPIHEAVISESEKVVRYLVQRGAQLSVPDSNGYTPLMYAAQGQDSKIIDILIQGGADPNSSSQKKRYPLHVAAENTKANLEILRTLLRGGAETLVEDKDGKVPLQTAIRAWRSQKEILASVKLLSQNPSTIAHQSHDGENALHDSVRCFSIPVLKYLVSRAPPAAINAQKERGQTPIFEALAACNISAFNFLVELPCIDLLATQDDKKTLLNRAAQMDYIDVAKKLINKEPRLIQRAEQHSISAIHYAVEQDSPAMFELLLEAGSDTKSLRKSTNLISYAAWNGRGWCLDALLKVKAWLSDDNDSGRVIAHRNNEGKTLLHNAALSGSSAVLKKILSHLPLEGLSIDDRDALGQTPLHCAARNRNEALVSLLLAAESDIDALTTSGESPLDLALEFEAKDTVHVLLEAGAHTGQGSRLKPSKLRLYENDENFGRLKEMLSVPRSAQRSTGTAVVESYKEKTVFRQGSEYYGFSEHDPDIPFLEIVVPKTAALPILRVIFETISHDQGKTLHQIPMIIVDCCMIGWSSDAIEWKGTYGHSWTWFDAAVQSVWQHTGDVERQPSPRILVQTNVHADSTYRTHVNIFDYMGPNEEHREWVRRLRPGDRIQLYAKARWPGWRNFVQKVKVTIHYHEGDNPQAMKHGGMGDSSERFETLEGLRHNLRECSPSHTPKVIIYHQSLHAESGILVPLRPLVRENTGVTSFIIDSFNICPSPCETTHMGKESVNDDTAAIHLNEFSIDDPSIEDFWEDVRYLQSNGIQVIGTLNIYGKDVSYGEENWLQTHDDSTFERCYAALQNLLAVKHLDGINLETHPLSGQVSTDERCGVLLQRVVQLLDKLHADFGPNFVVVVAASTEALLDTDKSSSGHGINLRRLELQRGHLISWYNVRISKHGHEQIGAESDATVALVRDLSSYIRLLHDDLYQPHRLVLQFSTSADVALETQRNLSGPFVDPLSTSRLIELLRWSYGPLNFGGIAGWEYSHPRGSSASLPLGGTAPPPPWLWVQTASIILRRVFSETEDD